MPLTTPNSATSANLKTLGLTRLKPLVALALLGLVSGIALGVYPRIMSLNQEGNLTTDQSLSEKSNALSSALPNAYPFAAIASHQDQKKPSSNYGLRIDPFTHTYKHHSGLDYSLPAGTPVLAAGDGKIKNVGYDQYSGQFIVIEHANGYTSKYAHLRAAFAVTGSTVKQGQQIGEVGSTGRSTSPHLHFEIGFNNAPINPLLVLNQNARTILASNQTTLNSDQSTSSNSHSTLQRVPFITNSGVTYRMVEVAKIK